MIKPLAALFLAVTVFMAAPVAAQPVDAKESFDRRQEDLVALAGHLGTLHRLQQVCGGGYESNLYRNRIQQVIRAEEPMGATRLDMIAAFNSAYRNSSRQFLACDAIAEDLQVEEARKALRIVDRLYAPFR